MKKIFKISMLVLFLLVHIKYVADQHIEYTTKSPIYVVGDIHGAFEEIHTTLLTIGLIDKDDNWSGGAAHFVSLGDMMDRGPSSRKVMDLYMKLQKQADEAGGKFHIVLGNHEVMVLTGDLRYLSPEEYAEFAEDEPLEIRQRAFYDYTDTSSPEDMSADETAHAKLFFDKKYPLGYFAHKAALSTEGKYGKWLLDLPFILKINKQIFVHGGLKKELESKDLKTTNAELKTTLLDYLSSWETLTKSGDLETELPFRNRPSYIESLDDSELKYQFLGQQSKLLFSMSSPTWYRGNALCHPLFETDRLKSILDSWDATRLWVGHTPTDKRVPNHRLDKQLIVMDTGMLRAYYKGSPWAAKLSADDTIEYINGMSGEKIDSVLSPNRSYKLPYGMSEEALAEFLRTAPIVDEERTEFGVTKPKKIIMLMDNKEITGIYKYLDTSPKAEKKKWTNKKEKSDRYMHDMAAFKLDRILGLGLVPLTVERKVKGRDGIVQLWIHGLTSKLLNDRKKRKYDGFCHEQDQINMLNTFDYLIRNTDRNHSNILYNKGDLQVWFIDHSRSFGSSVKQIDKDKGKKIIRPTEAFRKILRELTQDDLATLRPWLHRKQVKGIWKRRNKLLEGDIN